MKTGGAVEPYLSELNKVGVGRSSSRIYVNDLGIPARKQQPGEAKAKPKKAKATPAPNITFTLKPYGISSLENFLQSKIEKAKRTHQGT